MEMMENLRFLRRRSDFKDVENPSLDLIFDTLSKIEKTSLLHEKEAEEYLDSLCKPLGSLGVLENMYVRLNGIFEGKIPQDFKKAVTVFSSDNGICEEGISSNPQEITHSICLNILKKTSGLCRLSKFYGSDVYLEDLGVLSDVIGHTEYKINHGSRNPLKEPSLTEEEAILGIAAGIKNALKLIDKGYNLLGAGEMGVGNTSTSSSVISVLTGTDASLTTGLGSGLTRENYERKINTVRTAVLKNAPYSDVLDALRKVGGLDICAMAGTYLACASRKIPFVLDGIISMAALLSASLFNEDVLLYGFSSHKTVEKGARLTEELLKINPPLDLKMRLGEGSGCPIAMNLMEAAVFTLNSMATFTDVAVDKNDYVDIRKGDNNEKNS